MKNKLRVLRAERNWSQEDLAREARVSRQTINAIETGKYSPSLALAFKLSWIFEQPIEKLFEMESHDLD
jgi:putative transcriptional regulator